MIGGSKGDGSQIIMLGNLLAPPQCICLIKFLQVFLFRHAKTCTKNICTSINTHILEVDTYYALWREKKHMSIDTLEIEMTCITRQFEYYKLQLKYPENITYNNKGTPYTHLHT